MNLHAMYKHCTVCNAVQLPIHSLHSDLCGMCLGGRTFHCFTLRNIKDNYS